MKKRQKLIKKKRSQKSTMKSRWFLVKIGDSTQFNGIIDAFAGKEIYVYIRPQQERPTFRCKT